ncbi:MAG: SRPBCC domain-containing protein [Tepidisphaeraceae bacterium]
MAAVAKKAVDPGIGDDAVRAATGRSWSRWFKLLDAQGAREMDHKGIVKIVSGEFGVGPWWQQMVTVAYEQSRGLRELHQRPDGYSISASKTMPVPTSTAYRAWIDPGIRARWLGKPVLAIRKATPNKSLRLNWEKAGSRVEVMFYKKPGNKTQVTVQHNHLRDAQSGKRMQDCWKRALQKLADTIC